MVLPRSVRWRLIVLLIVGLGAALSACSNVRYYGQAVGGGLGVVLRAQPITRILARPETPEALRRQLATVLEIRSFAADTLGLQVGGNYRNYLDLGRDFVVWNVVAAPELDVTPQSWCFPIAGCVSYRGYFRQAAAERFASRLREAGYDVALYGVTAYSTLGWLRDPVLNTFLGGSEADLAGLLFHEIAHATVYTAGDVTFNESLATVIENAAVQRWLAATGREDQWQRYRRLGELEAQVNVRLAALRDQLDALYRSGAPNATLRAQKAALIGTFQEDFAHAIAEEPDLSPWRAWAERPLNNADLAAVGAYWDWVPALQQHLEEVGWTAFLDAMEALARLDHDQRQRRLEALAAEASAPTPL